MSTIKKTGSTPQPAARRNVSSCGPTTPTERAVSSCGGWVSKASRNKAERQPATPAQKPTVSSCGGATGWSRNGKIPSGC
jgi:hypothetical protein